MSDHEDIEDPRVRFTRQLAQISAGVFVMVPRLSEEEIIAHTSRLNPSSSPSPVERRAVLRRIAPGEYQLDSETDDEDEIKPPIRPSAPIRTILVTDSEYEDDDDVISLPETPSPSAAVEQRNLDLPTISEVFGSNADQSTTEPVPAVAPISETTERATSSTVRESSEESSVHSTSIVDPISEMCIQTTSSTVGESSDETSIPSTSATSQNSTALSENSTNNAIDNSLSTSAPNLSPSVCDPVVSEPVVPKPSTTSTLPEKGNTPKAPLQVKPSSLLMHHLKSNTSRADPSSDIPIASTSTLPSALSNLERSGLTITKVPSIKKPNTMLSIADAIHKTVTSMIPPKKFPLSMPSLDPDEIIENPNEIDEPEQTSNEAIEPEPEPEPVAAVVQSEPEPVAAVSEPEPEPVAAVVEPAPEPVVPVQLPLRLRIKSGAMLGITDNFKSFLCGSTVENSHAMFTSTMKNASTHNTETTAVDSVANRMIQQRDQISRNMDQIAILMKDQFIDSHNVEERRRILEKQKREGQYTNLQELEMENLDRSYGESSNTRYTEIIYLLEFCIDTCKNIKDVLRQIFRNFEITMKTVRKPAVLKTASIFSYFYDILHHALYIKNHSNHGLLEKLPRGQFNPIMEELRLEFGLNVVKTRKRIGPNYETVSQTIQNPSIPPTIQNPAMPPVKVHRAETTPYLLSSSSNIADTSIGAMSGMVSNLPMGANSSPMVPSPPVDYRISPVAPNPSMGARTTPKAASPSMGSGNMAMNPSPPTNARISPMAPKSSMGARNTQMAPNPPTNTRNIPMTPNLQNIGHLRPQLQCHKTNFANTSVCRTQLPVVQSGNVMGELIANMPNDTLNDSSKLSMQNRVDDDQHQAAISNLSVFYDDDDVPVRGNMQMNHPMNSGYLYGSNPHLAQFRSPPPYPQQSIRPEMMYHSGASRLGELAYRRMASQSTSVRPTTSTMASPSTIVRPNTRMHHQPPAGVQSRMSPSSGSPSNPFMAAPNQVSVLAPNPFVFPGVSASYSSSINSPPTTSYNPTMTVHNPNPFSPSTATNTYPTHNQQSRAPDQGYGCMTNPAMNLTIGSRAPAMPSNRTPTIVDRPQYVSARGDFIRNESSQNICFAPTQQTSFSIRNNPSLPSFTSNREDPPLSVHEVNSSISPTAGPSPSLETRGDLPLSVDFVQSSSSPNIDQICNFEVLGSISEPFLKDSEFEEFMKSNDLNVRMEEDEFGNVTRDTEN